MGWSVWRGQGHHALRLSTRYGQARRLTEPVQPSGNLRSGSAGNRRAHESPPARRADDLDIASQTEGSLSHRLQPKVSRKLPAGVEARAVVANLGDEHLARRRETKFDMARLRVLGRIVERLLGNPEQSFLDRERSRRLGVEDLVHLDAVPRSQRGGLLRERSVKPLLLERLRT